MEKKEITFIEYLKNLNKYNLPEYEDFPPISLYMEQVISYINETLYPIYSYTDKEIITSFMVNNYVKAKVLNPPKEKKYDNEHLAYLYSISLLKSVIPMRDIATLIDIDKKYFTDPSKSYKYFKEKYNDSLRNITDNFLDNQNDFIQQSSDDKDININKTIKALDLYILAANAKRLADSLIIDINKNDKKNKTSKETKKEIILSNKKDSKTAKEIRSINKRKGK
ncbi:MAG: DUF1836 domain-containing protein [Bacillales bacterium]